MFLKKKWALFAIGVCLIGGYFVYSVNMSDDKDDTSHQTQIHTSASSAKRSEREVQKANVTQEKPYIQESMIHQAVESNKQEESKTKKKEQIGLKPHHLYVKNAQERSKMILRMQNRKDRQKRMSQVLEKYKNNQMKGNNHE